MPSFDIVSEVNSHELTNAIDQTNREVIARFDFKDSEAQLEFNNKDTITLQAQSEFQLNQMIDIFHKKLAKRGIDLLALEQGTVETQNRRAKLTITVKQGINQEVGKKMIKFIKDAKLKVQASIQGDQIRVTGKKRDDLQQAIALLRGQNFDLPLQFNNFRD